MGGCGADSVAADASDCRLAVATLALPNVCFTGEPGTSTGITSTVPASVAASLSPAKPFSCAASFSTAAAAAVCPLPNTVLDAASVTFAVAVPSSGAVFHAAAVAITAAAAAGALDSGAAAGSGAVWGPEKAGWGTIGTAVTLSGKVAPLLVL